MKGRSVPGISLKPSNNDGGQYFMSLYSGKRIHSYIWEYLPINDGMIQRAEQLAELENKSVLVDVNPLFKWTSGFDIEEEHVGEVEDVVPVNAIKEEREIKDDVNDVNIQEGAYITDVQ